MITEGDKQRLAALMFGPQQIPAWVIAGAFDQLPKDAVVISHTEQPATGQHGWILCSKKFPPIEEGATLPKIVVQVDGVKHKITLTMPEGPISFMDELSRL